MCEVRVKAKRHHRSQKFSGHSARLSNSKCPDSRVGLKQMSRVVGFWTCSLRSLLSVLSLIATTAFIRQKPKQLSEFVRQVQVVYQMRRNKPSRRSEACVPNLLPVSELAGNLFVQEYQVSTDRCMQACLD